MISDKKDLVTVPTYLTRAAIDAAEKCRDGMSQKFGDRLTLKALLSQLVLLGCESWAKNGKLAENK